MIVLITTNNLLKFYGAKPIYGSDIPIAVFGIVMKINVIFIAIVLGLIGKFGVILQTIPQPVMGGVSIILFGMIAAVGVRTIVEAQLDFTHSRNLIIAALIFVLGIAIGDITIWGTISVSGLALAALVGIVLNKILPEDK